MKSLKAKNYFFAKKRIDGEQMVYDTLTKRKK